MQRLLFYGYVCSKIHLYLQKFTYSPNFLFQDYITKKENLSRSSFGRDEGIRTPDPLVPNQMR